MDRTNPDELRDRLYADKSWSKKQLGQHFLIDRPALADIIAAAEIELGETVVEIGPGLGVLTEELLAKTSKVVAFEFDPQMASVIRRDFPGVELVEGDVLLTAPERVASLGEYKVVANIPYQITTPLMRLFLEGGLTNRPERMVLLVQKEVAERLAAPAGNGARGYLSIVAQYFSEVSYVRTVPRTSFWPSPAVDSAVICFRTRPERPLSGKGESDFLRYVKAAYGQPRKQMKNVLAGIRGVDASDIAARFAALGLPETSRAQELTVEQWLALYKGGV
jgi:16S rRNA (adenine1518-N6/adenine1519-N6)-dimethyltransferase